MRNPKFQEQYDAILALHPELLDIESDKERAKQIVILGDTVMSIICQVLYSFLLLYRNYES
jgi:hypothetical protein